MSPDPILEQLQSLPEPPLPNDLWQRLDRRRRRRMAWRRGGVAAVLLGGFAFLGFFPGSETPAPAPEHAQTAAVATGMRGGSLQSVDRALQAAYARGASDDEVAPLWAARRQMALSFQPSLDPS